MENVTITLDHTYLINRAAAYPSIQVQLDMLYWDKKNGTNNWFELIDKIKTDNPKPVQE